MQGCTQKWCTCASTYLAQVRSFGQEEQKAVLVVGGQRESADDLHRLEFSLDPQEEEREFKQQKI